MPPLGNPRSATAPGQRLQTSGSATAAQLTENYMSSVVCSNEVVIKDLAVLVADPYVFVVSETNSRDTC